MRKWLNLYFDLSKREFNGLLALASLIAILTAAPHIYRAAGTEHDTEATDQLIVQALIAQLRAERSLADHRRYAGHQRSYPVRKARPADKKAARLFPFDPNVMDLAGWKQLGLSEKQSAAILKYVAKGGRFKKKEDLRKMYTIAPERYELLAPYVKILPIVVRPGIYEKHSQSRPQQLRAVPKIVELNTADSALLCEIIGIGPAFASRIIKYRTRAGGFYDKAQLMEVFGLDSIKYREISSQVRADRDLLRKININTATFEDLKNHPYLRYKQINALIQYRKQHGNYSNIADLNKVLILGPETIARMEPYLVFQ
jgi:competence protein ComEA